MQDYVREMNLAAVRLARKVADEFTSLTPDKPRFVAGSVGCLLYTSTKTFRVKGKWSGDCFSSFEARTYNPTTGKLVGEYVLE